MFEKLLTALHIKDAEEGATAVEYGIMVALIAAVIVLVVLFLGRQVCEGFEVTSDSLAQNTALTQPAGSC